MAGEEEVRRASREQLVASGVPREHVDQVVDLGFHAANSALDTLGNIVFSAADKRVSITALGVAIGIAQSRLAGLQADMQRVGDECGLPTRSIVVEAHHG